MEMQKKKLTYKITVVILVIDYLIKFLLTNKNIVLINNFFSIKYSKNYGAAWSIMNNQRIFLIITLVFIGCFLTCLGFFDKVVNFAKCGLIVPITGFAHSMTSAAIEYKNEGFVLGIGANVFKLAGTVILYGVVSVYFFGLIRLLIIGG